MTPQELPELPEKWRTDRPTDPHSDPWWIGYLRAKKECAEQLEAALAGAGAVACWRMSRGDFVVGWVDGDVDQADAEKLSAVGFVVERAYTHPAPVAVGVDEAVMRALTKLAAEFEELADAAYQECEYGRRDVWRDAAHNCINRSKRADWITAALEAKPHA